MHAAAVGPAVLVGPATVWGAWTLDPLVVTGLLGAAVTYAAGWTRLRRAGIRVVRGRQGAAFLGGLLLLVAALVSPLDALSTAQLSAHMVQHLILLIAAPPLLVYGRAGLVLLVGVPAPIRRRVTGLAVGRRLRAWGRAALNPFVVLGASVIALWGWHLPVLYQAALANPTLHAAEHLSFLVSALAFWSLVIDPGPRRRLGYGPGILLVFVTMLSGAALGALITFSTSVLYPAYQSAAFMWGTSALTDQHLAGAIMWIPPGGVLLVTMIFLAVRWFDDVERRVTAKERAVAGAPAGLVLLPLVLLVAILLLGGCSYFKGQAAPYRPAGGLSSPFAANAPVDGFQLYQRDCAWCHGNTGQGTANGPSVQEGTSGPAFSDFMLTTGRMPVTDPAQKDALHRDPAYTPQQVAAIVAFIRTFDAGGPDIPVVDLTQGSPSEGMNLYQANCAACHSTTGSGGALATGRPGTVNGYVLTGKGLVAPPLFKATPLQVAEAMRTGPPGMPVFGPGAFPDTQVDSIARYVVYLQRIHNPGGLALGRIGPVAEGAVGWLVGLVLLLLFTRWIGTGLPKPDGHGGGHP